MASLSDLDTSTKLDTTSKIDEDSDETLEPERDAPDLEDFENAPWDPISQLPTAQFHAAQLHAKIKARAELPIPPYLKLPRRWPYRLFDVRTLLEHVCSSIQLKGWGIKVVKLGSRKLLLYIRCISLLPY